MIKKLECSLLATALLLSGCAADKPSPPTEKLIQSQTIISENQSQINVEGWYDLETATTRPSDTQLRYVTQGDTSKIVALKTLQFFSMMLVGGGQTSGFTKNDLRGTEVAGFGNPSLTYLTPRINTALKNEMAKLPEKKYATPVVIKPVAWKLIYKNLAGGDDNYQLVMLTIISREGKDAAGKDQAKSVFCSAAKETSEFTLPQWQANNYAKVTEVTQSVLDKCLVQFTAETADFLF